MGLLSRLGITKTYCSYGCGREAGFCQCGQAAQGDKRLTGRHRVVENGRVTHGTVNRTPRRRR